MLEAKIQLLKEEQRKIKKEFELQEKLERDNSTTRRANFMWLVENLTMTNVISNETMAGILARKTGKTCEIFTSSSYTRSKDSAFINCNLGNEKFILKKFDSDIYYASMMENDLKGTNWFIPWTLRKTGVKEKIRKGAINEYSQVFCESDKEFDNFMFQAVDEYIMESIKNSEQQ